MNAIVFTRNNPEYTIYVFGAENKESAIKYIREYLGIQANSWQNHTAEFEDFYREHFFSKSNISKLKSNIEKTSNPSDEYLPLEKGDHYYYGGTYFINVGRNNTP